MEGALGIPYIRQERKQIHGTLFGGWVPCNAYFKRDVSHIAFRRGLTFRDMGCMYGTCRERRGKGEEYEGAVLM